MIIGGMGLFAACELFKKVDWEKSKNILNPKKRGYKRRKNSSKTIESTLCAGVYSINPGHKASQCQAIKSVEDHRLVFSKKKLCFNCTGTQHRAYRCRSNKLCANCDSKHHSFICGNYENVLLTTTSNMYSSLAVIINMEGITCSTLIGTGAGASYISFTVVNK